MDKLSYKLKVYQHCIKLVNEKISLAMEAVESAKQGAVEEERSTAGDKYDTARAMSHINQGMFANQLNEVSKLKKILDQIVIDKLNVKVESGALVTTSNGIYFIAASLGAIEVDGQRIMVISPLSPIGQQLLNKNIGQQLLFKSLKIEILDIV